MTHPRLLGLRNTFFLLLLTLNLCIYFGAVWLDERFAWVGISDVSRPWVYTMGIAVAFLYNVRMIHCHVEKVRVTRLFDAISLATRLLVSQAIVFLFVYFALKDASFSRIFLSSYLGVSFVLNIFIVRFLPSFLSESFFPEKLRHQAVLLGNGPVPPALMDYVAKCEMLGIRFIGYYSDREIAEFKLPRLGTVDSFLRSGITATPSIERMLAFNDTFDAPIFSSLVEFSRRQGIRLQIYTRFANAFSDPVKIYNEGELTFFTFDDEPLENPVNVRIKRLIDIAIALPVVVLVLPPLTLVVSLFQRLQSPGPVLFLQERFGRDRQSFTIYKYRSMHTRSFDPADERRQASVGDERIFAFGRFMRKTSLDEFPQFINVLRGEMSIVGPRPHLIDHDVEFEKLYRAYRSRHFVKPGITGYAQILGFRGEVKEPWLIVQRVENDLFYISNWSLQLDLYIIFKTACQIFFPPKEAY